MDVLLKVCIAVYLNHLKKTNLKSSKLESLDDLTGQQTIYSPNTVLQKVFAYLQNKPQVSNLVGVGVVPIMKVPKPKFPPQMVWTSLLPELTSLTFPAVGKEQKRLSFSPFHTEIAQYYSNDDVSLRRLCLFSLNNAMVP